MFIYIKAVKCACIKQLYVVSGKLKVMSYKVRVTRWPERKEKKH